jgi:hypothetical protein
VPRVELVTVSAEGHGRGHGPLPELTVEIWEVPVGSKETNVEEVIDSGEGLWKQDNVNAARTWLHGEKAKNESTAAKVRSLRRS